MPPKKSGRKRGGTAWTPGRPSYFVLPNGMKMSGKLATRYGGNLQNGSGWFSDLAGKVWKGVTGVYNTGKNVYNKLKDTKVISKVASAIPHPAAQRVAAAAKQYGLGPGRRVMVRGNATALL